MYKAVLSYDGTRYFGWQKTVTGPSIQEELEKALLRITQELVLPEAASRTDRGVHAEGQVIQFALNRAWELHPLQRALNAVLPPDIRIRSLEYKQFHPTLDALGKEYHYRLTLSPVQLPMERLYAWHLHQPLDLVKMIDEAQDLLGTHDFSAFTNEEEKDPICNLESITFTDRFIIRGNRFLYKMVRNIVGTLIYVGLGKLNSVKEILLSRDRRRAGITAPALGLYLHRVFY
jgi:tRNA pseudouridine38-40 synthase